MNHLLAFPATRCDFGDLTREEAKRSRRPTFLMDPKRLSVQGDYSRVHGGSSAARGSVLPRWQSRGPSPGTSPLSEANSRFLTRRPRPAPAACGVSLQAAGDKVSLGPSSKLGCFVSVKTQLFFSGVCRDCSASGRCMKTSTSIQHPFSPRQTWSDFNKSKSHTV